MVRYSDSIKSQESSLALVAAEPFGDISPDFMNPRSGPPAAQVSQKSTFAESFGVQKLLLDAFNTERFA